MRYVVTGANRGIGLEFCRQLLERGDAVVATCRDPEGAEALRALTSAAPDRAEILQLSLGDDASEGSFVEALQGPIDALINNAGVMGARPGLGRLDYAQIRHTLEINALAPIRLTEALLDHLRQGQGKRVMNLTSQMGSIDDNGSGGAYAYRMSKAALNMGTRSLSIDVAGDGIVAFVIHPGWVQTDMGGPHAKITTETSVSGMLEVLDGATRESAGCFMNWDGDQLPW